jgi:hypothetical protein
VTELKDYLNSINISKHNLMDESNECESSYPPYIINRCFSGFLDTILIANEMNLNSHLDKKLQYDFYINIIRPKKRFSPWIKKEKLDSLESIKQYYGYSDDKAKTALKILTEEQIEFIKSKLNRGGRHER